MRWPVSSMDKHRLSLNSMGNILRDAGAERVSQDAKENLREYLESHAVDVAELALTFTKHADRTTVQGEDILSSLKAKKE